MSEIADPPVRKPRSLLKILLVVLFILFLLLVYGAGIFILPMSILYSYQGKNCDSALPQYKIYTGLYPDFMEDKNLSSPVKECESYTAAASAQEKGNWREAYDAYQSYSSTYPNGLYATETHQQSGAALFHLAQAQIEQEKYEEALANLNLIVASFSDTGVITDAWNLYPGVYTPWGVSLREAGDFGKSEQVLNDFKTWSLTNQKSDFATDAQRELAQTYLAWGLDLQSQKQFEDAIAKLELAASADPHSQFDAMVKVKTGQSSVYVDWGNDLLQQEQFPAAIEKFELALSKSDGANEDGADALANGQIQWAHQLSADEDFEGALEHLKFANQAAVSEVMKKSLESALQETYVAFSNSSGSQARRAMKEALKTVCEKHKTPDLPIFGLNKASIRFGIYGVDDPLPESLNAKTPGEMHYVACVTADNRTIESSTHKKIVLQFSRGYFYVLEQQFRVQVIWKVSLLQTDTGKSVAEQTFTGEEPPPFSETGGNYFYGKTPIEGLALWLPSILE